LRECRWSNGDPVTAEDFRASWLRVLDPTTASPLATLLFGIDGARAYNAGQGDRAAVGVGAPDARTLVVKLDHAQPWFPQMCASSPFVPVHPSAGDVPGFFVKSDRFVGNGPFVLDKRIPNDQVVLRRNPLYWDVRNVTLERIVAFATESKQAAVASFVAGRSDWVDDFPAAQASAWLDRRELRTAPYLATYFLRFNTTRPPFDDRRIREAFHCALDRKALCERILRLGQRPATCFVPRCIEAATGYRPVEGPGFDPARARQRLTEAGYPGGRGIGPVPLQFDTTDDNRRIAEAIQAMLKEHLGVDAYLVNKEKKALIEDEERLLYAGMSRGSWIADYADPSSFLDIFESGSPSNRTGFASPEYDGLLTKARRSAGGAERLAILAEAERLLVTREFPLTPVYEYVKQTLVNPDRIAGGFQENLLGYHPMKWIRLRP
jgi:oligopeptide transport system substrate-binding protein